MKSAFIIAVAALTVGFFPLWSGAAGLAHDTDKKTCSPLPAAESALQTVIAEPWARVFKDNNILEGAIIDNQGNLLFCDVTGRRVMRLTPDKKLETVVQLRQLAPGGLGLHPDGRLFIAAIDPSYQRGGIAALNLATGQIAEIVPTTAGYLPNDLVIDKDGGLYFTDFKGSAAQPLGGVYYLGPDLDIITPVLTNLALANGVTLSPDGKILWATEFGRNLLHRLELDGPGSIAHIGPTIPYHFIGSAPDSMRADVEGNVYVAMYGQGRILVFNDNGVPIGQILLPGRNEGRNLRSTSLAIAPGKKDLYAVTSDALNQSGAMIFKSGAFANGQQLLP